MNRSIPFEKEFSDMVTSLKFRDVWFISTSNKDIHKMKSSPNIFAFPDKTNNTCEMIKDHHQRHHPN